MVCTTKILCYTIQYSGQDTIREWLDRVGSQTNKHENPVFKLFAEITSLENFRLYGSNGTYIHIHTRIIKT